MGSHFGWSVGKMSSKTRAGPGIFETENRVSNVHIHFKLNMNMYFDVISKFTFSFISNPWFSFSDAALLLAWLSSLIYREETGYHRHFGMGYVACIRKTSGFYPRCSGCYMA